MQTTKTKKSRRIGIYIALIVAFVLSVFHMGNARFFEVLEEKTLDLRFTLRGPIEPGPETVVVRRAEDRRVLEAVGRLRPADQEILRLAGWEEMPHADIAEVLGISAAAVDQRFHRAKRRLAREYDRAKPVEQRGGAA